jgi:hypothetical protein
MEEALGTLSSSDKSPKNPERVFFVIFSQLKSTNKFYRRSPLSNLLPSLPLEKGQHTTKATINWLATLCRNWVGGGDEGGGQGEGGVDNDERKQIANCTTSGKDKIREQTTERAVGSKAGGGW